MLCADKIRTRQWLDVMRAAHTVGFRSTATIMFGRTETRRPGSRSVPKACALSAGVNDLGGTLMDESISCSAGGSHGQEMTPQQIELIIRSSGRVPRQPTTLYGDADVGLRQRSLIQRRQEYSATKSGRPILLSAR